MLLRIYDLTEFFTTTPEEVFIITKWRKSLSPDPFVGGLRLDPCLLGTW